MWRLAQKQKVAFVIHTPVPPRSRFRLFLEGAADED
jgi:hypothetical protein